MRFYYFQLPKHTIYRLAVMTLKKNKIASLHFYSFIMYYYSFSIYNTNARISF